MRRAPGPPREETVLIKGEPLDPVGTKNASCPAVAVSATLCRWTFASLFRLTLSPRTWKVRIGSNA